MSATIISISDAQNCEVWDYPQPQAQNPSHGPDVDYSVDVIYSASADKLTVFFNRTEWRTHNVLESFSKGYPVENNILTPVVAQKMFHDIVDWTQHNIRPLEYESLTVKN